MATTTVIATLGSLIDAGLQLYAHHERIKPYCSHSAPLDLERLAETLGRDFDLIGRRTYFLTRLRCTACGDKGHMGIVLVSTGQPRPRPPLGAEAGAEQARN